jgi:hypothetical protein
MKEITVTIDLESAGVEVDLDGYQGKGCSAIQEGFARAIGKSVSVTNKPEFNRPCKTENKLQQRS